MPDLEHAVGILCLLGCLTPCVQGLIRSVGVSNFGTPHLEKLAQTAKIPPAVNQAGALVVVPGCCSSWEAALWPNLLLLRASMCSAAPMRLCPPICEYICSPRALSLASFALAVPAHCPSPSAPLAD